MARVPASEATRKRLNDMLAATNGVERVLREAVRLIVEETLEAEVSERLGRGYYDRAEVGGAGQRNGYRVGRLDTAEGRIEYAAPQVRSHSKRVLGARRLRCVSGPKARMNSNMYAPVSGWKRSLLTEGSWEMRS